MVDYSKLKICVGYPSPDKTDYRFNKCLFNLIMHNWQHIPFVVLTNAVGSRIVQNRNTIVEDAYKAGATHILWIDADTVFPTDGLARLLVHDKDIVCATTSRRLGTDRSPAAYPVDMQAVVPFSQLVPMRIIGLPFMLTKMSVFDKLQKPYFAEPPRRLLGCTTPPEVEDVMPEDEYFCHMAREAGFEVLCDMELSMEIGHVGTTIYYIDNPNPDGGTKGNIAFELNKG